MELALRKREHADVVFLAVATGWCALAEVVAVRQTCKQLYNDIGAFLAQLTREIKIKEDHRVQSETIQRALVNVCNRIVRVEFVGCPRLTDEAVDLIRIKFGFCLEHLTVMRCPLISSQSMRKVAERCLHLRELHTDVDFSEVLDCLKNVKEDRQVPLRALTVHGVNDVADSTLLDNIRPFLGELQELSIDSCWLPVLLDLLILPLKLKSLNISNCFSQTSFDRAYQIEEFTETLSSNLSICGLEKLSLEGFLAADGILESIISKRSSHFLRSLFVGEHARLTTLNIVGEKCPNLTELFVEGCARIGDTTVQKIATKCTELQIVRLRNCPGISRVTIDRFAAYARGLTDLDVSGCPLIGDDIAEGLSKLRNIKTLNLSNCRLLSNNGLKAICKSCPQLRSLGLANCSSITDEGALAIARWSKQVVSVDLSWCLLVTPFSLEEIIRECHALSTLTLLGCTHIPSTEAVILANSSLNRLELRFEGRIVVGKGRTSRFKAIESPSRRGKGSSGKKKKRPLGFPSKRDLALLEEIIRGM